MTAKTKSPTSIPEAILAVKSEVVILARDHANSYSNYNFASVDDFIELMRPLMVKHGIYICQSEFDSDIRPVLSRVDAQGEQTYVQIIKTVYEFTVCHRDGTSDMPIRRTQYCRFDGPQSVGASQSYAWKFFVRSLFMIATGEPDLDTEPKMHAGTAPAFQSTAPIPGPGIPGAMPLVLPQIQATPLPVTNEPPKPETNEPPKPEAKRAPPKINLEGAELVILDANNEVYQQFSAVKDWLAGMIKELEAGNAPYATNEALIAHNYEELINQEGLHGATRKALERKFDMIAKLGHPETEGGVE